MSKRLLDLALTIPALLLLAPLMIALATAVRLESRGPAVFRQQRLGLGGRPFAVCKFRSMYIDAPDLRNADGSAVASGTDPRVTPLGRWLRATSLDELPQLLNVLRGDMSLVGPRPDQVDQLRFYSPGERRKLEVRPGLTGLAQISGRNSISWTERKALDVRYVNARSLALDLQILFKTIPYVLLRRGIHTDTHPTALGQ
jgi:lipopolysaccharide/colanic/teichoic acid biosynthesis glycosyltransferase